MDEARVVQRSDWSCGIALSAAMLGGLATQVHAAATNFTTVTAGVVQLNSWNGSSALTNNTVTLAQATGVATGPWNDTNGWTSGFNGPLGPSITGGAHQYGSGIFNIGDAAGFDVLAGSYQPNSGTGGFFTTSFDLLIRWEITLSASNGAAQFNVAGTTTGGGVFTYTPSGGSAATLNSGDVLVNGSYTIEWQYTLSTGTVGSQYRAVLLLSNVAAPSAVPGSGLAAIGSLGLAGLARRRRR